jgi:hypothetical protein
MADISKYSVVDPRILQQKPKYAVEKGAVSITNQTFSAIANSASQQTFQVQVPSENVFVDRAVDWVNEANVVVTLTYGSTAGLPAGNAVLLTPGVNFSLAPFPLTQSVSTMQATINDQSLSINTADVLPQVLRLADLSKTRKQRTCPTMLDRYYDVQPTASYPNSPVGSYGRAFSNDEVPCGAWGDLSFYIPSNAGSGGRISISPAGLPLGPAVGATGAGPFTLTVGVRFRTAEKLVLPPFIFADEDELSTGLFGVQNMQFTMNFNQPGRSLRIAPTAVAGTLAVPPVVTWDSSQGAGTPFTTALVQVQFLTPSLDVPLPAKSIVPWMEFPRYISPVQNLGAGLVSNVQSQTITLPMIPDLLVLFVKPQTYASVAGVLDPTQADWSLPITNISLSFDNFSGLLSNHSQYELYKMSVNNGLEMDWDEWSGYAWGDAARVPLVGGPLVLRPGRDFQLSTGQAPGLIGNFTLQFNLTIENATGETYGPVGNSTYGSGVSIYTVTANSGFFETIRGSSRILRGVVTEQDILGAPVSEPVESMERMVGEGKRASHSGRKKGMHAYVR